jgi:hypothetical protein
LRLLKAGKCATGAIPDSKYFLAGELKMGSWRLAGPVDITKGSLTTRIGTRLMTKASDAKYTVAAMRISELLLVVPQLRRTFQD